MSEENKKNELLEDGKIDLTENTEESTKPSDIPEGEDNQGELTDEEKREQYIELLKASRIRFQNTVHDGNVTRTKFGEKYKKKRNKRNKLAKKSRQRNRK